MSQSPITANTARIAAQSVLDRARVDPDFLAALSASPIETLQTAGFLLEDAREFSEELGGEVVGYLPCRFTCDRFTCWVTKCGNMGWTN